MQAAPKATKFSEITPNMGYYAVKVIQGNRCWYLLLVINLHSRTVSKLSQIIVQIWYENGHYFVPRLRGGWGLRGSVRRSSYAHWKAVIRLPISDNWTYFARCYGWGATSEYRLEVAFFEGGGQLCEKIQVEGKVAISYFLHG